MTEVGGDKEGILRILSEAAQPRLKLFLSADIVGSTAHKQALSTIDANGGGTDDWPSQIQEFYSQVSESFKFEWDRMCNAIREASRNNADAAENTLFGTRPKFWKTVGDDVIFWKELQTEDQIWCTLLAWMNALATVRTILVPAGLDVKGTAWLAGFPVRNRAIANRAQMNDEIDAPYHAYGEANGATLRQRAYAQPTIKSAIYIDQFYRSGDHSNLVDFIGAGIDVGFRVAKFSSTLRMAVSIDVAYLMALSYRDSAKAERIDDFAACIDRVADEVTDMFSPDIGSLDAIKSSQSSKFPNTFNRLKLHYSGMEPLKGVLGEVDYPIFWFNTAKAGSLDSRRFELDAGSGRVRDWETIRTFCEQFYDDRKKFLFRPFIHKSRILPQSATSTSYDEDAIATRMASAHAGMGLLAT